jgi:pimeloyl-ACP methyl ester carboxylesterase
MPRGEDAGAAGRRSSASVLDVGLEKNFLIPVEQRDRILLSQPWPFGATVLKPKAESEDDTAKRARALWRANKDEIPIRCLNIFDETPISEHGQSGNASESGGDRRFWEALLRFPNAPLYATHWAKPRMYEFPKDATWPNLHTMRIIGVGERPKRRIRHVYLLHNGLNETRDFLFHYRLAAWILDGRDDAVCIIRPLPGHLTRFPFHGFYSETPLDEYLRDPMDLFRQFLRYMLETQWLLSIIAPRSHYDVVAGGSLVEKPAGDIPTAQAARAALAANVTQQWEAAFEESKKYATKADRDRFDKSLVTKAHLEAMAADLHSVLGWKLTPSEEPPVKITDTEDKRARGAEFPYVHVVGYSIGGFMAQSCFFGWPQVVSSCTNLFAGGALRDVAPTAFANPEEWQTVLHALRYELDSSLSEGPLAAPGRGKRNTIAGITSSDFRYMKRIFYEVYLQYYRGGYSSRVAEFSRRLLFIVGGDDPIVQTKNVLDAGPPQGITLLQLANVSHFPGGATWKAADEKQVEQEQRIFWLPEIGRVIARFSTRTEVALHNMRAACWGREVSASHSTKPESKLPAPGDGDGDDDDGLDSSAFESALDALLDIVGSNAGGWLLISRNEIPPVFLGPDGFRAHARALHHSEELIARYIQELRARADQLADLTDRMTLLIPEQSTEWLVREDLRQKLLARSETPGAAHLPTAEELKQMLRYFNETWVDTGAVSLVTAAEYEPKDLPEIGEAETNDLKMDRISLTMLPDVWIGIAPSLRERLLGFKASNARETTENAIVKWAAGLTKDDSLYISLLDDSLRNQEIVVLKVSAAEFNPRYRGHVLAHPEAERALRHWALAYRASRKARCKIKKNVVTKATFADGLDEPGHAPSPSS